MSDKNKIGIRLKNPKILQKYKIWADHIKLTKKKNKDAPSKNELLCQFLEYFLDGKLSETFYKLFFKQIESALNETIFKRNFGLINFLENYLRKLCKNTEEIKIKLNLLINCLINKKIQGEYDYEKIRDLDWMIKIKQEISESIDEEFKKNKQKNKEKDKNTNKKLDKSKGEINHE